MIIILIYKPVSKCAVINTIFLILNLIYGGRKYIAYSILMSLLTDAFE